MKTLIHKLNDSSICILKLDESVLIGKFFNEKPIIGDIIMSFSKRIQNKLKIFEVTAIIENKDAKINSSCKLNPINAHFKLGIKEVQNDNIDNSINILYK